MLISGHICQIPSTVVLLFILNVLFTKTDPRDPARTLCVFLIYNTIWGRNSPVSHFYADFFQLEKS